MTSSEQELWATYYQRAQEWVKDFAKALPSEAIREITRGRVNIPQNIDDKLFKLFLFVANPYVAVVTNQLSDYVRNPEDNCLVSSWMYRTLKRAPELDYMYMEDALQGIPNDVLPGLRDAITDLSANAKDCFSLTKFTKSCIGEYCKEI